MGSRIPYDAALLGSFTQSFSLLTLETNPLKQADAEGRAMYLESSSVKNNAYYKKFGFEAKRDIHLGLSVDDNNNNSVGGDANSRSSTSLSSSSSSDSESGPKPAVTLTVMVREPRRKLANSIPIKLSGGFVGGGGGKQQ